MFDRAAPPQPDKVSVKVDDSDAFQPLIKSATLNAIM
jgi:hypothetical protein